MGLLLMILASAVLGSLLTLLTQFLLLYRKQPEPPPDEAARAADGFRYIKPVPDLALREYLYGGGGAEEPSGGPPEGGPTPAPETPAPPTRETCYFLNATILFLFRELRDTALARRWVTKKIKVEFEELLQTKTAGRLLEGLSLRDVFLGEAVPFIKTIRLLRPVVPSATGEPDVPEGEALPATSPEELAFEAEVEYSGGFHLAIDVDLVFGKSAYLFVKLSRVVGRLRFVLTRVPFTHWFFSFVEDPLIDFEVRSQFEGRPMPQLTSIIVNQLKKVIKRKHTLPSYKIRLLIFGSYDREANIHCTLELSSGLWEEKQRSSIKTVELIKGNLQSVGLTLRLVQSTDGYAGHVIIETVAPNSPAAIADLQRGDRLIAIGGVKITSTLQVLKLIKQAGDRVLVYYERPVGQSNQGAVLQDNFGQLEDNFLIGPCQPNYEEETSGLAVDAENRDLDSEFEDLASDVRAQTEVKDEAQSLSHSPKRTPTTLSVKPLGTISPVLNRKLVVGSYPPPPKLPSKEENKPLALKSSEITEPAQVSKPTQGSTFKPPVPPRPQVKVPLPSADAPNQAEPDILVEKPEKVLPPPAADKPAEKQAKNLDHVEEAATAKQFPAKQEVAKDLTSESSCTPKDSSDDHQTWESSEILYRNKLGKWTRTRASCLFDIEACHRYLNIALWCRDPFKLGGLICLGHVSLKLEEVALGCLATSNMEYLSKFRLEAPSPKAMVTRTALRNLSMQKGFNDKFCFGDITVHFKYLKEGEPDHHVVTNLEKEKELHLVEEVSALPKEEHFVGQMGLTENKHSFQDTQFQNPTWCDYCKKKVWTKAASQCMFCAYVCHKKCQEKCLAETPLCGATDQRIDRALKNLRLEGQEALLGLPPRVDAEAGKSVNRMTGLTRHIINTSSRLLNLRQVSKTRLSEPGTDLVEPSPKHTPNTSDNEGSDTEICGPNSPSKQGNNTGIKLVRKEGGLDDSVFIAVKEIGRDLYRGLPTEERIQKLEFMLDKLQNEIDQELEHNNSLVREEKETTDTRKKSLLSAALAKSGERLQALTLLMIHYRAGIEDIESLESLSLDQHSKKISKYTDDTEEDLDSEITQLIDSQPFSSISDDLFGPSESV
ncbi:PDZ domain-containing protein 8 isoform X3 [Sagmatias obliquidens]|uniref:PDZ domain-containing protein 8 n=1 Tax=Tursiops truncatus TaxID=9739 RepID=A0A2U4BQY5_TURTR|nr:PDZ domain-containing protein 8 isoform X2 [Tursiops truncatus]XP_026968505.1 PDZ domain-containing protein 8 isoform X3 [Lagenorhynchus obliquidens]